ncbi:CotH kinase family protein [Tessaracoccus sp. Y1736]
MQRSVSTFLSLLSGVAVIASGAPLSLADSAVPEPPTSITSSSPGTTESTSVEASSEPAVGETLESAGTPQAEEEPAPTTSSEPAATTSTDPVVPQSTDPVAESEEPGSPEPAEGESSASSSVEPALTAAADPALMAVSDLPTMFIDLADAEETRNTLDFVHADKDNEVASLVDLVDPSDAANDLTALPGVFEGRGNFTWTLDKKPYQIKFKTAQTVLGMPSHRTWVLLANHADPSLLRNRLAYDLAADFGLAYSPETRFVDLVVEGEYLGNYLLSEKTEVGTNRVELQTNGGILAELDNNYGTAEDTYFAADQTGTLFVLKGAVLDDDIPLSPELQAEWDDFRQLINDFEELIYAEDQNWEAIASLIDAESFLKYYFVVEVAENPDVRASSVYFYRDGPGDVLHAGPVWDFDIGLGNYREEALGGNPASDYVQNVRFYRRGGNDWFAQLFRNPEFFKAASRIYQDELQDDIRASLSDIDLWEAEIKDSAQRNFDLWDDVLGQQSVLGTRGRLISSSWESEVAFLANWVGSRIDHLDRTYGEDLPIAQYPVHVSSEGWQPAVTNTMIAGTATRVLPIEAARFTVTNTQLSGGIAANAHIRNIGWSGWAGPGALVGTTGRSLTIESLQLRFTGDLAANYDLTYRVKVRSLGWLGWVSNGTSAGTTGRSLPIEALQLRITKKSSPAAELPSTIYRAHVQSIGWMSDVEDGDVAGTTGQSKRMEAFRLRVDTEGLDGDIQYRAHVQNIGWMPWQSSSNYIGTVGRSLRLEALEIRLTGELARRYSIAYRAHVSGVGWQPYKYDGALAGTTGQSRRVEAVTVELIPKRT